MNYLNMKDEKLLPVVIELNTLLADYHIYYQKLRNFHWNILGENFFDLHKNFEVLYTDAQMKIDEIAERILTLRYHPLSKFSDYLKISSLNEGKSMKEDTEMVNEILSDHKLLLIQMSKVLNKAESANDEGTLDLIGSYIRQLEKASWMLDAWTKKSSDKLKRVLVE